MMTLQVMDDEAPRGDSSISNRLSLLKAMHIEKLMKRNKVRLPLRLKITRATYT